MLTRLELSNRERRYLFGEAVVGAALINVLINAAIGWAITQGLATFPIWKLPGAGADLVATAFGVTFGTCIGAKISVRWDIKRGKFSVPAAAKSARSGLFPENLLVRSVWLGALSVPVFAFPLLLALFLSGVEALSVGVFIALKAGFSAVQAALITPFIVLAALSDVSRRAELK